MHDAHDLKKPVETPTGGASAVLHFDKPVELSSVMHEFLSKLESSVLFLRFFAFYWL